MRYILSILLIFVTLSLPAQVTVSVRAPQQVTMDQQFRFQLVVNSTDVDDVRLGKITGFDVLHGPSTSTSSSVQIINGHMTQNSSMTLTYIVAPNTEGKNTIGESVVVVGGKEYKTKPVTIEVLPADQVPSRQQQNQTSSSQVGASSQSATSASSKNTGKDLFIVATASKKRVYEQEAVLITYKVYTLLNLVQLQGNMPELNGCHQQEIELSQQKSLKLENYNGRNYRTCVWSQYVVFPQQTGKVTIPPIKFEGIVQQTVRSMDPFEAFFGGGSMVQEVKKTIMAPSIELQVDALPSPKPANFSGAVGQFTLSSTLTPQNLDANDALTLHIVLSGTGNMKLVKAPQLTMPADFETYDPKITEKTHLTTQGTSGNKVFDYVSVPRHAGDYSINAVEFCYFDPQTKQYKTLKTEPYNVHVNKGKNNVSEQKYSATQKEDLLLLAEDIRFVKRGKSNPQSGESFFGSASYFSVYGIVMLLFTVFVIIFRRHIQSNADIAGVRLRKSGKIAAKRLKKAKKLKSTGNQDAFYDEVLLALWGYVADKLNIDVSQLNADNVSERLAESGVSEENIRQFLDILERCQFARYAQGVSHDNMDTIYDTASHVISVI